MARRWTLTAWSRSPHDSRTRAYWWSTNGSTGLLVAARRASASARSFSPVVAKNRARTRSSEEELAFPSSFFYKIKGLCWGFLAIQLLNAVRIISLFYLLQWDKNWFEWFHLYVWQALIILDALVVWLIWLRYLPKKPKAINTNSDTANAVQS